MELSMWWCIIPWAVGFIGGAIDILRVDEIFWKLGTSYLEFLSKSSNLVCALLMPISIVMIAIWQGYILGGLFTCIVTDEGGA